MEFLQADYVGILRHQESCHGVCHGLFRREPFLALGKGETSHIVGNNLDPFSGVGLAAELPVAADDEQRGEKGHERNPYRPGTAEYGPDDEERVEEQERDEKQAEYGDPPCVGGVHEHRQIAQQQEPCRKEHHQPRRAAHESYFSPSFHQIQLSVFQILPVFFHQSISSHPKRAPPRWAK